MGIPGLEKKGWIQTFRGKKLPYGLLQAKLLRMRYEHQK
jgi:hypothetical protein